MQKRKYIKFKVQAIALRRGGQTYTEIQETLKLPISSSTLSDWFKYAEFSSDERELIALHGKERIQNGSIKTASIKKAKRDAYFQSIHDDFFYLKDFLENKEIAKLGLVMLYLCEGSKTNKGSLCFGNSNPDIIKLFLRLFRNSYPVDETKLRCTVQCRADQDTEELKLFWAQVTNIPFEQFYKPKIDKRTIGIPTKKLDYKGVCRIDYFSAAIYNELLTIGRLL